MAKYFKLKRPFATKTEKLPEGTLKLIASYFKELETRASKIAGSTREVKILFKKCSSLQSKLDKEQNEAKQAKLNEQLSKLKDELADKLGPLIRDINHFNKGPMEELRVKNDKGPLPDFLGKERTERAKKYMRTK